MTDTSTPTSLPMHKTPYFSTTSLFNDSANEKVRCYFHASNRGYTFPLSMHSHEFYEINIITNGEGEHYINDAKINIMVGDVFIIPPKVKHGYFEINDLEIFHILLNEQFFTLYKKDLKQMNGYLSLFDIEPLLRCSQTDKTFLHLQKGDLHSVLKDIIRLTEYSEKSIYHYNIQSAIVYEIICKFCLFYGNQVSDEQIIDSQESYASKIIYGIEFMKRNLSRKLTINDIARYLLVSPATFKRYFTEICKTSPMEYLTNLRIEKAKKLLRSTDATLAFIAQECGFYDSSHFCKQFTKTIGITPSKYKNKLQQPKKHNS